MLVCNIDISDGRMIGAIGTVTKMLLFVAAKRGVVQFVSSLPFIFNTPQSKIVEID